ncbi:hypothetical protein DXG03_008098 [Asterophora parasitica]|uniref:Uncharacterized protein n=1 Tax=Asterophora parasitica TaxID=117018 RepID=A0A9P7GC79_9AGAR|nr:hypothetical protein DXG03_008098 [Asterophora parasitica]
MHSQESVGTSSGPFDSDLFAGPSSRRSRIHFPVDDTSPSRTILRPTEQASRLSPAALKTSPARRNSPLNPHHISSAARRRVRSIGTSEDVFADTPLSRRKHASSLMTPPRGLNSVALRGFEPGEEDNSGLSLFSDEYDLAHEDPRILQDVQRALKLKARREARLSNKSTPPKSEMVSYRPTTSVYSAIPQHVPVSPTLRKETVSYDLDFGPSTTTSLLHPVPASLDNGITLDWSGFDEKPETRWKLAGAKRKEKEVMPPLAMVMEQQETAYADKLARLKAATTPQTLRKAKITQDQLGRRYNLTYGSLSAGAPLNINKVAQWYSQQDALIRNSLEKAEPFTWLKHLERRGAKPPERYPWNISALMAEEFIQAQNRHDTMATIPEDSSLRKISPDAPLSPPFVDNHLAPTTSRTSSNNLLGPSIARKFSFDGGATFEPHVDSTRTSLDIDPHHRSYESSFSSLPTGLSSTAPNSPTFNRALASRLKPRARNGSSVERLLSEESDHAPVSNSRILSPKLNFEVIAASSGSENEALKQPGITVQLTPTPSDGDIPRSQVVRAAPSRPGDDRILGRRRVRRSFPTADRTSKSSEAKQRQEADEEKAHDIKTRLLEQTAANNHRIRQVLNRVSVGIREFESAQSNAMASLGIAHIGLPRELIDAFGHDPAAVTGATRRFTGWRAVDDIQNRLIRQRDVFQAFLSSASSDVSVPKSVLDDPISSLVQSLEALETHGQKIAGRAFEVCEALKSVQATHVEVKEDYKGTLSRVSVVYPELSYIVALEESYKDQYQQVWEFGMDTLTFLLDSVTPFWRTYGKPIGEDIRDFLIIPLYRNEFTGEAKRYPILCVPSRSFRHWTGLVLFFFASVSVNVLQARAALSSSVYYKLPMIPYESLRWTALPFFWISIVIQWWAVLVEFVIVFLELAVVFWWVGWSIRIYN